MGGGEAPSVFPLLRGEAGVFARSAWSQLLFRPVLEVLTLLRGPDDVPDALLAARHAVRAVPCRQSTRIHLSARHAGSGQRRTATTRPPPARVGVCRDAPTAPASISLCSSRPSSSSDEAELRFIAATPLQ